MSNISEVKSPSSSAQETENTNHRSGNRSNSTPIQQKKSVMQEVNDLYSPIFSQCTQEENDKIDVMWDWYSPQSKPRTRKHKRGDVQQSPKLLIKRQHSNNQITEFNKLKEDLETLRNEIVEQADTNNIEAKPKINCKDLEDVFNDSMEEQLVVCSQEAERNLFISEKVESNDQISKYLTRNSPLKKEVEARVPCNRNLDKWEVMKNNNYVLSQISNNPNSTIEYKIENNTTSNYLNDNLSEIADDSFDFILETMKDEDLEIHKKIVTDRKIEEWNSYSNTQNIKQLVDPTPKCTSEEIQQKRRDALAKLETKKKQVVSEHESPIKCSPEEIEQKRLQAIAKLKAKKKQDIIERNRLEALKRLEMNKKKRALQTQASLSRKTHSTNI